jgi:hypothetical protein
MTRHVEIVVAALMSLLLVAGCSSVQVMVEKNPDADFDAYGTWEWFPGDPTVTGDPRVDLNEDLRNFIMSAVEKQLAGRGYKRSGFSPDLYVDYHVTLQDVMNSQVIKNYYGESYYPDFELSLPVYQDTYKDDWEEGSLLLMVFDSRSKRLVWRGIASTEVNTQGPRQEAMERIDKAVEKLVKELPET